MKINSINHHSRNRQLLTDFGPSMTDESQAPETDINFIVANFRKTGILPQLPIKEALKYFDVTQVPSFQDAQNIVSNARSMFEQLPAQIRYLMKNNPANAEDFLKDPKNHLILSKYGLLDNQPIPNQENAPEPQKNASGDVSQQDSAPKKTSKEV